MPMTLIWLMCGQPTLSQHTNTCFVNTVVHMNVLSIACSHECTEYVHMTATVHYLFCLRLICSIHYLIYRSCPLLVLSIYMFCPYFNTSYPCLMTVTVHCLFCPCLICFAHCLIYIYVLSMLGIYVLSICLFCPYIYSATIHALSLPLCST